MVTVEFTQDTFTVDADGDQIPQRVKGQRVRVDAKSAQSLVEVKKVAKIAGTPDVTPKAKVSAKTAPTPEVEPDTVDAPVEGDQTD